MKKQMEQSMKFRKLRCVAGITLFAALALPVELAAQHTRYKLVDLGTFGGPNAVQNSPGRAVNSLGAAIGGADLPIPDPYAPNCLQFCFVNHAFVWQKGVLNALGFPAGVDSTMNSSFPTWITDSGLVAGLSENGLIDTLTGFPQVQAVVWNKDGIAISLGGLGGNDSQAFGVNNRGQVVGVALNTIPDTFAQFMNGLPAGTQARAVLWQDDSVSDLGTLGGPDAAATSVNERGQIVGFSFTDSAPDPDTGLPPVHPFLWEDGRILDLGTLGGSMAVPGSLSAPGGVVLNNRGQVVGTSNKAGDQTHHAFLWERGALIDLGTLGGNNSDARAINEGGEIVGNADFSPNSPNHHAYLWRDGVMTDLGTLGVFPCSTAYAINSRGQVVGNTGVCGVGGGPPFLSEHGQPMVDLTTLVLPGSPLTVTATNFINERGEIYGTGRLPNGDPHVILLVPAHGE
jgi:probable HAF family extracellular repeat protein